MYRHATCKCYTTVSMPIGLVPSGPSHQAWVYHAQSGSVQLYEQLLFLNRGDEELSSEDSCNLQCTRNAKAASIIRQIEQNKQPSPPTMTVICLVSSHAIQSYIQRRIAFSCSLATLGGARYNMQRYSQRLAHAAQMDIPPLDNVPPMLTVAPCSMLATCFAFQIRSHAMSPAWSPTRSFSARSLTARCFLRYPRVA